VTDDDQDRPGLSDYTRQFFTNWSEYDASVEQKLWLTFKNRSRAMARTVGPPFTGCCGHHGEPGC
jgi:hypothetical protein